MGQVLIHRWWTKFLVTNLYFLVEFTPILCAWDAILSPSMVSHTWETQSTNDKFVFQKKSSCKWGRQECQIFYPYWPHTHERWGTLTARLFCKVWFPTIKHVGVSNFPPQSNLGGAEVDCDTAWCLYWGFTTLIKKTPDVPLPALKAILELMCVGFKLKNEPLSTNSGFTTPPVIKHELKEMWPLAENTWEPNLSLSSVQRWIHLITNNCNF